MTTTLATALEQALRALASGSESAAALLDLGDDVLVALLDRAAAVRRLVDARTALLAGEVARRSTRELAHSGLAQRLGHRTPEELVRVTTSTSRRDAHITVAAGIALLSAEPGLGGGVPDLPGWAHALVEPVKSGVLSVAGLEAIRSGLGTETASVSATALGRAVNDLLVDAVTLDVDRLCRRARQLRDELDLSAVADREAERREARSFRVFRTADGMSRATWLLDPESAAVVLDLYDRATSPRRGGPTFLSPADAALAQRIRDDERTPEQYASDTFLDLLRAGADADARALLSSGAPSVRVLVTAADLSNGSGFATLEGQSEPISLPTAERLLCAGTHTPILISTTGQPLDVGRTQRFFTARQRIALSARDGGCRWNGCERPPSWCEAHHIQPWAREHGASDVADGVLLCRHHHLLVHNNGWRVERHRRPDGVDDYRAIPPTALDPAKTAMPQPAPIPIPIPIPMPSRSEPLKRALRESSRTAAA